MTVGLSKTASLTSTPWKMLLLRKDYLGKSPPNGLVFDPPNTMALVSVLAGPSQMTPCTAKLDTEQGISSAITPLVIFPSRPMLLQFPRPPYSLGEKARDHPPSQQ